MLHAYTHGTWIMHGKDALLDESNQNTEHTSETAGGEGRNFEGCQILSTMSLFCKPKTNELQENVDSLFFFSSHVWYRLFSQLEN